VFTSTTPDANTPGPGWVGGLGRRRCWHPGLVFWRGYADRESSGAAMRTGSPLRGDADPEACGLRAAGYPALVAATIT